MGTQSSKEKIKKRLKPGCVYRRTDFEDLSSNPSRDLKLLVEDGELKYLESGLYHYPKKAFFGEVPPKDDVLLAKYLRDDRFVSYNPSMFNRLRLGTTQVYNKRVVFNRLRHGEKTINGKTYHFRKRPDAPRGLSTEFLLVEMINTLDDLVEDREKVLELLERDVGKFHRRKLLDALRRFGDKSTQKIFERIMRL